MLVTNFVDRTDFDQQKVIKIILSTPSMLQDGPFSPLKTSWWINIRGMDSLRTNVWKNSHGQRFFGGKGVIGLIFWPGTFDRKVTELNSLSSLPKCLIIWKMNILKTVFRLATGWFQTLFLQILKSLNFKISIIPADSSWKMSKIKKKWGHVTVGFSRKINLRFWNFNT